MHARTAVEVSAMWLTQRDLLLACARTRDENFSVFPRKQIPKQNKEKQNIEKWRKFFGILKIAFLNSLVKNLNVTEIQHESDQCDFQCASALMDLCATYKMPKSRFLSLLPRNKLVDILNRIMKVLKGESFATLQTLDSTIFEVILGFDLLLCKALFIEL